MCKLFSFGFVLQSARDKIKYLPYNSILIRQYYDKEATYFPLTVTQREKLPIDALK